MIFQKLLVVAEIVRTSLLSFNTYVPFTPGKHPSVDIAKPGLTE